MSDILEYLTRSHKVLRFDKSYGACSPFGFFNGQRVQTPKGPATVVGVHTTPAGEKQMWFHVDGQDGASFWDNGTDYDSLVKDVGVTALEPPPPASAPAPSPQSKNASGGLAQPGPTTAAAGPVQGAEQQSLDRLAGMFSTLDANVCLDALRGADGNVTNAVERLLTLTTFQREEQQKQQAAAAVAVAAPAPAVTAPLTQAGAAMTPAKKPAAVEVTPQASPAPEPEPSRDLLSSSTDTVEEDEGEGDDLDAAARDEHLRSQARAEALAATEAVMASESQSHPGGSQKQVATADAVAAAKAAKAAAAAAAAAAAPARAPSPGLRDSDDEFDFGMLTRMKALQEENARIEAEKRASMDWCIAQVEKARQRLKDRDMLIARLETENAQLKGEVKNLRAKQQDLQAKSQALLDDHIQQLTASFAQLVTDQNE